MTQKCLELGELVRLRGHMLQTQVSQHFPVEVAQSDDFDHVVTSVEVNQSGVPRALRRVKSHLRQIVSVHMEDAHAVSQVVELRVGNSYNGRDLLVLLDDEKAFFGETVPSTLFFVLITQDLICLF